MSDTDNKFFVGSQGNQIVVMRPTQRMSKDDALNLAAWIVALADDGDTFPALLEKVQNT